MLGLSGGGWPTAVYSALDPTITLSFPISGTQPLYLWGWTAADAEQLDETFYRMVGYPDLYVMGAYGKGRKQIQVRNWDDPLFSPGCHPGPQPWDEAIHEYEANVSRTLLELGAGSFRLFVNEAAGGHVISWNTIVMILGELDGGGCVTGSGVTTAFVRGADNHLWRHDGQRWQDTGIASVVGAPAVIEGEETVRYPLVPRHRCDWSKRYSLCSEEGPGLIGNITQVPVPQGEITIAMVAEACKAKDPIMKSRTCVLESCIRHCPAGLAATAKAAAVSPTS